jgi:hypothetical protein
MNPQHTIVLILESDLNTRLINSVADAGFTDGTLSKRNGKTQLTITRGFLEVSGHSVVVECCKQLLAAWIAVLAVEVFEINEVVTACYREAQAIARDLMEDKLDGIEIDETIKFEISHYDLPLDEYMEIYANSD